MKSIAEQNRWAKDWLNEAVTFHLSPLADRAADHIEFGSFPQDGAPGLDIVVPTAPYLLALKLKAIWVLDAVKGEREAADIRGLMASLAVDTEGAMEILRRYFPVSAADGGKQEFFLRHLGQAPEGESDAPCYGR